MDSDDDDIATSDAHRELIVSLYDFSGHSSASRSRVTLCTPCSQLAWEVDYCLDHHVVPSSVVRFVEFSLSSDRHDLRFPPSISLSSKIG